MIPAAAGLTVGCARLRNAAAGDRERLVGVLGQAPLPVHGLLWISRLKVRTPLRRGADNGDFVREVGEALRGAEAGARRPGGTEWSHGEALFFENEAMLAATLIAQWLCGAPPAARSWWPHFTGGASPQQWWRAAIVPDARLMPRVLGKLTGQGLGPAWLAALDDAAVEVALGAVASAYGYTSPPPSPTASATARQPAGTGPIGTLASIQHEVATSGLPERRRLLFGAALLARGCPEVLAGPQAEAALAAVAALVASGAADCPVSASSGRKGAALDDAPHEGNSFSPDLSPLTAGDLSIRPLPQAAMAPLPEPIQITHAPAPAAMRTARTPAAAAPPARVREAQARPSSVPFAPPRGVAEPPETLVSCSSNALETATGYAGLLFVINALLALGLYGDFASPRRSALAISPWALLRRLGCRWLGRGFERDPLHELLTHLAGGPAGDCLLNLDPPAWPVPGYDAAGRHEAWDAWLDGLALYLQKRIAAALGRTSGRASVRALCRRPGTLLVTEELVVARMLLETHPLAVRVAGLDRDPGWVPAAGRIVEFVFE